MLSGANPNTASARNDFERAFQLDSTNVEALNNLGYVYEMLVTTTPLSPLYSRCLLCHRREQPHKEISELQKLNSARRKKQPTTFASTFMGLILWSTGNLL